MKIIFIDKAKIHHDPISKDLRYLEGPLSSLDFSFLLDDTIVSSRNLYPMLINFLLAHYRSVYGNNVIISYSNIFLVK